MVKKSTRLLAILAIVVATAGMSWGYTVSEWGACSGGPQAPCCPCPGSPVFQAGCGAGSEIEFLRGPVAPSCEAPLIPGAIHAALSIPFRAIGLVATPLMAGQCPPSGCCDCDLGEAAYVTAAVPCTSVGACIAPRGY